jgi:hypothetical protein
MKSNKLNIRINKSLHEVFLFTITPPNSTKWIPSVMKEETNKWPIKVGTVYKLTNEKGEVSEVAIKDMKENEMVEWVSKDKNYHCRYNFQSINGDNTEFNYYEWVDKGQLGEPFNIEVLNKLKFVLEAE